MESLPFSRQARAAVIAPERWRLVGTGFPADLRPVRDVRHARWAARHSHAHANRELLLVLSGRGRVSHGGAIYPSGPGSVFLFDSMTSHDVGYPSSHPVAEHLWITFVHDQCAASVVKVRPGRRYSLAPWRRLLPLSELGLVTTDALFPRPEDDRLPPELLRMRCAAAAQLLVAALVEDASRSPTIQTSDFREQVVLAIQRHIREHAGRGCRLESLARIAGYSKFHFLRLFRQYTGAGLHEFINDCRRLHCRSMTDGGASQKSIASALGFAHPSAFTRWRKRNV